ncbi:MAG: hypothetical protein P4M11_11485 [Candidatus Pacebacteria bacterium]|nr:hypothetical protein [Candidatus Paceibacterota bacterium]
MHHSSSSMDYVLFFSISIFLVWMALVMLSKKFGLDLGTRTRRTLSSIRFKWPGAKAASAPAAKAPAKASSHGHGHEEKSGPTFWKWALLAVSVCAVMEGTFMRATIHGFARMVGAPTGEAAKNWRPTNLGPPASQPIAMLQCDSPDNVIATLAPKDQAGDSANVTLTVNGQNKTIKAFFPDALHSGIIKVCSFYDSNVCISSDTNNPKGYIPVVTVSNLTDQPVKLACEYESDEPASSTANAPAE